jgi:mannitol/fructose-specific phosphotransferase system IIA component (Ntr-type)
MPGLASPVVALGLSSGGVDFGAPDGELARFIVLVVTPEHDDLIQLELLAEIARTFQDPRIRAAVARCTGFDDLVDALRQAPAPDGAASGG